LQFLPSIGQDEIVGETLIVIEKIILDHIGLVAKAKDKVFMTVVCVILHNMPKDWPIADSDHGLRDRI
jgi:hypothetical protein